VRESKETEIIRKTTQCQPGNRHQVWIRFLEMIDRETVPEYDLHFTPTSSSWLNLIERWFAERRNNM